MADIARIKSALLKNGTYRSYDELLLLKAHLAKSDFIRNTLSAGLFPKQLDELCRSLMLESFEANELIIRQNAVADKMFIVLSGSCDIRVKHRVELAHGESEVREKTVFVCMQGMHFGERALMNDEPRAASVVAKERTDTIVITKLVYNNLLKSAVADSNAMAAKAEKPGTKGHLMKVMGKKRESRTKLEIEAVAGYLNWRIPFFRKFTPEQQLELCRVSEAVSIWGETVLFKQGSIGEAFYVILTGTVEVWVSTADEITVGNVLSVQKSEKGGPSTGSKADIKKGLGAKVATLGMGDTFGERALENEDSMRMASIVTCESLTEMLVISREDYHKLVSALLNSTLMTKITLLRKTDLFRNVDATHLRELARYMEAKRYEIEDYLFRADTRATELIIIDVGEVVVEVDIKTYSTTTGTGAGLDDESGLTDKYLDADGETRGNNTNTNGTAPRLAKIQAHETIELGRIAPASVLAPYVTQLLSPGERVLHPESVRATTLVRAYAVGLHDYYSNMKRESKKEITSIVASHVRSALPSLWEQTALRFGQKEWHQQAAWKKYKEHIRDKKKSLTYNESLQTFTNILLTPNSGNIFQNRRGAIRDIDKPVFFKELEEQGQAKLTEEDLAYTSHAMDHVLEDAESTYSDDTATMLKRSVDIRWGLKPKEKKRDSASKQLGIDITSTHPIVAGALASNAKREKQRLLDTLRGASENASTPAQGSEDNGDGGFLRNGSMSRGSEDDPDTRRLPFSLVHLHQETHQATPASVGVNRLLSMHMRHCGTMHSCKDAKYVADQQMREALTLLFGGDMSKAPQLGLVWRSFTGFESLALDKSDLLIVYCRSVPVEYACISPEKNLLDMPYPSICKQRRQFYACMRMKAIAMPKVVIPNPETPQIRRRKRAKKPVKYNEYGLEYDDTDEDGSADEDDMLAKDRQLQAEGLPSGHSYKIDKLRIAVTQPFLLQELKSFAETLATSTTHAGSLMYGKTFLASKLKADPLLTLTRATSLPADLFHGKFADGGGSVSFAESPSRAHVNSRGGGKKDLSLMEQGPSETLSHKPNVEQKGEKEYVCVLPLYQWIVIDEKTLVKYDIEQIKAWEGDDARTQITSDPDHFVKTAPMRAAERKLRLRGRDSVDLAFFEAGMTSNTSAFASGVVPTVEPHLVRGMENKIAAKNLSDTVHKVHLQRREDDIAAREEARRKHLYRGSNLSSRSLNSSVVSSPTLLGEGSTVATGGGGSPDGCSVSRKKGIAPSKAHQGDAYHTEEEDALSFAITKEREQALADVIRERMRMIHLNDKLCMDEGKMKPIQQAKMRREGEKRNARSTASLNDKDVEDYSSDEDELGLASSFSTGDLGTSTKKSYMRGVSYVGGGNSGALGAPGGMGLLGQRMDMYDALNSLPSSRTAREREILRSNSLNARNNKRNKSSKESLTSGSIASSGGSGVSEQSSLTSMNSVSSMKGRKEELSKTLNTVNEFLI